MTHFDTKMKRLFHRPFVDSKINCYPEKPSNSMYTNVACTVRSSVYSYIHTKAPYTA